MHIIMTPHSALPGFSVLADASYDKGYVIGTGKVTKPISKLVSNVTRQ